MAISTRNPQRPICTNRFLRPGDARLLRGFGALLVAACLISPSRADGTLDWVVSAITGRQSAAIEQPSTTEQFVRGSVVQPNQKISTGSDERVILTHGQDVLELAPNTTVTVGNEGTTGQATIVKLLDGTVHVKVGKRAPGRTFSVETRFLVATVKGTEFDVSADDEAAAVSVSEGRVSVRGAGADHDVDVTPGRTAVAAARNSSAPSVGPTPAGGAPAAAKAAGRSSAKSNGAAPSKGHSEGGSTGSAKGAGNGNGDGSGNGNGNGKGNGGSGSGNGKGNGGSGNGDGKGNSNGKSGGKDGGKNGNGKGGGKGGGHGSGKSRLMIERH